MVDSDMEQPLEDFEDIQSESAPDEMDSQEAEHQEDVPDDGESDQEERTFDGETTAKIVRREVAKQIKRRQEVEDQLKLTQQQLEEFRANQPKPQEPQIPDLPNPDDYYGDPEGFNRKIAEREKAIAERAEFQASQRAREQLEQQEAYKRQQAQQREVEERVKGYVERAKSFGVDEQAMQRDAQTVAEYLPQDLQDFIVKDQHGPLISSYLANNLLELDNVRSMSPIEAAAYIASEVRPKVSGTRKTTQAPKPASIVNGGAAPERKHPALEGVKFE